MPFTPFHMGPAALLKAVAGRHFSLTVFGLSQILIDLEPLARIVRGDDLLHGYSHTLAGALLVGALAAEPGRRLCERLIPDPLRDDDGGAGGTVRISRPVAWASALTGSLSHLLLDGAMHADIRPLWPLTDSDPWRYAISVDGLHEVCVALGLIGLAGLAWRYRTALSTITPR